MALAEKKESENKKRKSKGDIVDVVLWYCEGCGVEAGGTHIYDDPRRVVSIITIHSTNCLKFSDGQV